MKISPEEYRNQKEKLPFYILYNNKSIKIIDLTRKYLILEDLSKIPIERKILYRTFESEESLHYNMLKQKADFIKQNFNHYKETYLDMLKFIECYPEMVL